MAMLGTVHPPGKHRSIGESPRMGTGASLTGVCLATFLTFAGASSNQFHSYLFERLGFGPLQVGFLVSAGFAAGILSPLAQVRIIRFFGGASMPLLLALGGAALCLGFLPAVRSFPGLLLLFFLFSF